MAAIFCKKTRVAYFPAPKNASSSLRRLFFELENGFEFRAFSINGNATNLFWLYRNHETFKAIPVPPDYEKIIVVRNPISRFISTYKWLVKGHDTHFHAPLEINDFVVHLEIIGQQSSKARFHLMPQSHFFGSDLSYFHRVFRIEDIAELYTYLSGRSGLKINLPRENQSNKHEQALSRESLRKLGKIYEADYELLQKYYPR
jgi:Sulfotransferase family